MLEWYDVIFNNIYIFVSFCLHVLLNGKKKLRDELTRALLEAKEGSVHNEEGIESFDELVREMTSKRQDIKTFAFKTKAMVLPTHLRARAHTLLLYSFSTYTFVYGSVRFNSALFLYFSSCFVILSAFFSVIIARYCVHCVCVIEKLMTPRP